MFEIVLVTNTIRVEWRRKTAFDKDKMACDKIMAEPGTGMALLKEWQNHKYFGSKNKREGTKWITHCAKIYRQKPFGWWKECVKDSLILCYNGRDITFVIPVWNEKSRSKWVLPCFVIFHLKQLYPLMNAARAFLFLPSIHLALFVHLNLEMNVLQIKKNIDISSKVTFLSS